MTGISALTRASGRADTAAMTAARFVIGRCEAVVAALTLAVGPAVASCTTDDVRGASSDTTPASGAHARHDIS